MKAGEYAVGQETTESEEAGIKSDEEIAAAKQHIDEVSSEIEDRIQPGANRSLMMSSR